MDEIQATLLVGVEGTFGLWSPATRSPVTWKVGQKDEMAAERKNRWPMVLGVSLCVNGEVNTDPRVGPRNNLSI